MKNRLKYLVLTAAALPLALAAQAQYRNDTIPKESPKDTSLVTLTFIPLILTAISLVELLQGIVLVTIHGVHGYTLVSHLLGKLDKVHNRASQLLCTPCSYME